MNATRLGGVLIEDLYKSDMVNCKNKDIIMGEVLLAQAPHQHELEVTAGRRR